MLDRADRVFQREQREVMVRKWCAWSLPDDQTVRMAVATFGIDVATARRMLRKVRLDLVNEARAIEAVPMGERRHADRVRLETLFYVAIQSNQLGVAVRCADSLIRLNGTMPVAEEIPVTPVPEAHQAARRESLAKLQEIVASQRARLAVVPRSQPTAADYVEFEEEPADGDDGDDEAEDE